MDRGSRGVVGKRNRVTDSKRDTGMRKRDEGESKQSREGVSGVVGRKTE